MVEKQSVNIVGARAARCLLVSDYTCIVRATGGCVVVYRGFLERNNIARVRFLYVIKRG